MKIISTDDKLSKIDLRLRSIDRRFQWVPHANCYPATMMTEQDRSGYAYIEFEDSQELEQFLYILQRFKDENVRHFGEWV